MTHKFRLRRGNPMSKELGPRQDNVRFASTLLLLSMIVASCVGCTSSTVAVGHKGQLFNGFSFVTILDTKESLKAFVEADQKSDQQTKVKMYQAGQVHTVPAYTRVLVLENDLRSDAAKVQILDGERVGTLGWVPIQFVKPLAGNNTTGQINYIYLLLNPEATGQTTPSPEPA